MIERFEDIAAWKVARRLRTQIWSVTRAGSFQKDGILRSQIRKAAHSIMSNIAEGFERDGNAEFLQFLSTSKASAGEVRSHLYAAALDEGYVSLEQFDALKKTAVRVGWLIERLMHSLRTSEFTGRKFRKSPDESPLSDFESETYDEPQSPLQSAPPGEPLSEPFSEPSSEPPEEPEEDP